MGRPIKRGVKRLTGAQVQFVKAMARTDDVAFASKHAGYASESGGSSALNSPEVQRAILEEHKRVILEELAPAALQHLSAVLAVRADDGSIDRSFARVQNDAAKIVLGESRHFRDAASGKDLHEMTYEENVALLEAIRTRIREEAIEAEIVEPDPPEPGVFD